jgi:hypothetical protein
MKVIRGRAHFWIAAVSPDPCVDAAMAPGVDQFASD